MFALQNTQPIIVTLIDKPTPQTTFSDVFVGAFVITGLLVLLAVFLGVGLAFVRVKWHQRHPPARKHLPPITSLSEE